jgi:lipopolysaccharide export system protein LptC
VTISTPKVSGFSRDGRAYNMTAETATQDLTQPGMLDLTGIEANLALAGGGSTKLNAKSGVYDSKAERLRLNDGIVIISTNGFNGKLEDALIEMRKGYMVTKRPVDLHYQDGRVTADRMEIFDNGARAVFEGKVTTWLRLPPASPPEAATAGDKKQ